MSRVEQSFDCAEVLDVLKRSDKGRSWSSLAAELLAIDRSEVRIAQVRGIRNCCRELQAQGIVRELPGRGPNHWPTSLLFQAI